MGHKYSSDDRAEQIKQAIAHGAKSKKGIGPSEEVAKEFIKKTPKKKRSLFMKKDKSNE